MNKELKFSFLEKTFRAKTIIKPKKIKLDQLEHQNHPPPPPPASVFHGVWSGLFGSVLRHEVANTQRGWKDRIQIQGGHPPNICDR